MDYLIRAVIALAIVMGGFLLVALLELGILLLYYHFKKDNEPEIYVPTKPIEPEPPEISKPVKIPNVKEKKNERCINI